MPDLRLGRLMTAMVSPFGVDGGVDLDAAAALARHLAGPMSNDSIVVNGTTGEAPTTSDAEKMALIATVKDAVGPGCNVVAGVGTFDTEHTIELARQAAEAGADGLLVVTPYYSKPPQDALLAHFLAVADSTELPIILYDIPKRTGTPIETATLVTLAEHPNIIGVKDAKGEPAASSVVMAATDLAYYAGDDAMTLPLMAVGGVGLVGTSTHFTGRRAKQMIEAFAAGRTAEALTINREMLPVFTGVFATQGCMLVKSGLAHLGMPVGGLRRPLLEASQAQADAFNMILDAATL